MNKKIAPKELERRKKISQTLTGFKRPPFTPEHREKIRQANLGNRLKPHVKKILLSYALGNKFNLGRKHTEEWMASRKGCVSPNKGKPNIKWKGKNNPNWKGGITPINKSIRHSLEYKIWRRSVFERDDWTCVWCGAKNGNGKTIILNADHIKPFYLYHELRFAIDNGRTLCVPCHKKTDTWKRPKK